MSSSPSNGREQESLELPDELDILWLPTDSGVNLVSSNNILPEELQESLDSLLITLHPKNQHRAVYPSGSSGQLVEPTLGIYCPLEGGHSVVDATVRELAFRTGSEVLVLDAVQLAAGEWGAFGKAAAALDLPRNTLHFSSPLPFHMDSSHRTSSALEEEDRQPSIIFSALKTVSSVQGRSLITTPSRRTVTPPSKLETFFETLVNFPSDSEGSENALKNRPRLIYIRDFPILAPSSSVWYPPLLAAVRNRRKGSISRPSSVVTSPTTIIFGWSPPLAPVNNSSTFTNSSEGGQGGKSVNVDDWSEGEAAELAREERWNAKISNYLYPSAFFDDCPKLSMIESRDSPSKPEIVFIGPNSPSNLPPLLSMSPIRFEVRDSDRLSISQFFRSSLILPSSLPSSQLRDARVSRRREINELIIRMEIGVMGGVLESMPPELAYTNAEPGSDASQIQTGSPLCKMWEAWGNKIEEWLIVREIADRAMGGAMILQHLTEKKPTLEPTPVPWSTLQIAWAARKAVHQNTADVLASAYLKAESVKDKVVETLKDDPELDPHERRLISCIVDPNSITTSFKQVHLPPHTIDSVRTIVSLPLLHPYAFQQGILKDHSMTGCLLFGPPGTGKTLVVRALAKEADCRMLAISPSDVMDMYVGEGEKLVKAVFSLARRLSPCVVFLDEIDALFGARMSNRESGSAVAQRGVITEFMQEMDGLKSSTDNNVIVIGATNRPFDLDDAVLRRLPRRLLVDLPGEQERQEILRILLRDEILAADVTIEALAARTDSFSGSDLKHLCVSAALDSVKEHVKLPWKSELLIPSSPPPPESRNTPAAAMDGHSSVSTSSSETLIAPSPTVIRESSPSIFISSLQQQLEKNLTKDGSLSSSLLEPITPAATLDNEASSSIFTSPAEQPLHSNVPSEETPVYPTRVLHLRNFLKALREITPSSSESFGSLADLRKWNEEFGEGRKDRKRRQVWGKGQFGFVEQRNDTLQEGRVAHSQPKL